MKKMYYVVDCGKNDEWTIGKFESKEEAIKEARSHWDHMSDYDKKDCTIEVRDYAEDVESEDCNNFDYDTIEWGYIIRDREAGNEIEKCRSKEEVRNTLQGYVLDDREEEPEKSDQELLNFYEVVDVLEELPIFPTWNEGSETVAF